MRALVVRASRNFCQPHLRGLLSRSHEQMSAANISCPSLRAHVCLPVSTILTVRAFLTLAERIAERPAKNKVEADVRVSARRCAARQRFWTLNRKAPMRSQGSHHHHHTTTTTTTTTSSCKALPPPNTAPALQCCASPAGDTSVALILNRRSEPSIRHATMSWSCQRCRQPLLLHPSVGSELDLNQSAYDLVQDSFIASRQPSRSAPTSRVVSLPTRTKARRRKKRPKRTAWKRRLPMPTLCLHDSQRRRRCLICSPTRLRPKRVRMAQVRRR